jgi:RNase P protein component
MTFQRNGNRLMLHTNFQIGVPLRRAINDTRGVNFVWDTAERHRLEIEVAKMVGPNATERNIRQTIKDFFTTQNQ